VRVSTGLKKLDSLIEGGFPPNTVILISGGPGTGKTLIGLNFLVDGATKNERCYCLSLCENKEELLRATKGIKSLNVAEKYLNKNLLIESFNLGDKIDLDYLTKNFSEYPKIDRLVIDNVNKLLIYAKTKREYRVKLEEMLRYLRERVRCTLLLCETIDDEIDTRNGESFECDGVIHVSFLELEEKPKRTLEIYKLRYTAFEPRVRHEITIDNKDIKLTTTKIM